MEAQVICHPCLHQHTKQEWNKGQCLFEGLERSSAELESHSTQRRLGKAFSRTALHLPLDGLPLPTGQVGCQVEGKVILPNSGLDKRPKNDFC